MSEQTELIQRGAVPELAVGTRLSLAASAEPALVGLAGFLLASVLAASDGGYFSDSWAWLAFVSLTLATLRLILAPALRLRRLDWAFAGGLGAFAAWVALSTLRAPAATPALDATLLDASYAAVVLALLLLVRRRTVGALLFGALLGVTVVASYSLLTRLHPDWVGNWDPVALSEGYRLSGPVGYWNALGLYSAMGVLLALGLVARSPSRVVQAVAGAVPVLLVPTILFTFSRGAWLALTVGLVAAIVVDPRRLQLAAAALVLAPWPAAVLLAVSRSDHLTERAITLSQASAEGGPLIGWILALSLVSAAAAVAFRVACGRVRLSASVHRMIGATVLAVAAVGAIVVFATYGAPWTLVHRAADSFTSGSGREGNATARLFSVSSNGRVVLWHVSIHQFKQHPVRGEGAGSYEAAWNQRRPAEGIARNAHSLYLEVLGELGIVGLVLLVSALGVPLVAAVRARSATYAAPALAAYVAFLAVAAVDWDWQLAGVTVVGLLAAVGIVVSARGDDADVEPRRVARVALPAATGVLALLALAAVLSTVPLARANAAYDRLDFREAAKQAQTASDWAPWSSEALDVLGRSQLAEGQLVEARASFRRTVEKSPNNWVLWRDLAAAAPTAQARVALRRARALNPLESELKQLQEALATPPVKKP